MAQESTAGGDVLPGTADATHLDTTEDAESHHRGAHTAEVFGAGVSVAVLACALVGIAATVLFGASVDGAFIVATGAGLVLAPLVGLLFVERGD
jgi:hypothetical protein